MKTIQLSGIRKSFLLPHEKRDTLKERLLNLTKRRTYEHFQALQNVDLTIEKGDFIGIVGKNGSGKSTLLKIIAGIYTPDEGEVMVEGKIAPFLELGIGFQPELTARENIMLNATLLGMERKEIVRKFDEIVDFAEVRNFLDLKMKNFSSGMQARLAFSIAIQADADIYLCDEVLAVGDQDFQQKCLEIFKQWKQQGKTILFVSHSNGLIEEFCNRAVLLEHGAIIKEGSPFEVLAAYTHNFPGTEQVKRPEGIHDFSKSDLRIADVRFYNTNGNEQVRFKTGDTIIARIFYDVKRPIEKPVFGIAIHREDGTHISGPNTKTSSFPLSKLEKSGAIDCVISQNSLLGGQYLFTASCFDYSCVNPYDYADKKYRFSIEKNRLNQYGLIEIPVMWQLHE